MQGDPLQPVVSVTGAGSKAQGTVKARRPPRKSVPIKEREYDPDKHCGVVISETLKPCTWSLTCKVSLFVSISYVFPSLWCLPLFTYLLISFKDFCLFV